MTDWPDAPDLDETNDFTGGFTNAQTFLDRVTKRFNILAGRVADIGDVTSGIFTGSNGCTLSSQRGRIIGNVAWIRCTYTLGSAAVSSLGSPGTTGVLTNTTVFTIADSRFQTATGFATQSLDTGSAGRIGAHVVTDGNEIWLTAVAGSAALSAGDTMSFFGSYLLN